MTEFQINKWIYTEFLEPLRSKIEEECLKKGLDLDLFIGYNEKSNKVEITLNEWKELNQTESEKRLEEKHRWNIEFPPMKISVNLDKKELFELGHKKPYFRYMQFPSGC